MIIIFHEDDKVIEIFNQNNSSKIILKPSPIAKTLVVLSQDYPDEILVWCHESLRAILNIGIIDKLFNHQNFLFSFNPTIHNYLSSTIGYIEDTPFIKINKTVCFPTWQMSSAVGAIHSSVINACKIEFLQNEKFDYILNSFAKRAMPKGLFCYSEPRLLKEIPKEFQNNTASLTTIFQFTKAHYKLAWVYILFLNLLLFEKRVALFPLLRSFLYQKIDFNKELSAAFSIYPTKKLVERSTLDVIIPTIGREKYLYNFLKDLVVQTYVPTTVIIVEQNPLADSISELNFITDEKWPFEIKHTFIHQAGACNARNIALQQITSEWVFLADDDIRINKKFIEETFDIIQNLGSEAVTIRCSKEGENQVYQNIHQCSFFGSGCSFVKTAVLKNCQFLKGYEYGFGEDIDFGMQIRNKGYDVLYLPEPNIIHLKAPIGGFRTKPILKWSHEKIQPKPSPTIMLYKLLYYSKEQLLGYKTMLFFKYYKSQFIKNPIQYIKYFRKQWKCSTFWANELMKENEV